MSNIQRYKSVQEGVTALATSIGNCPNFDNVTNPYREAAAWEEQTGDKISRIVGTNGAFDMVTAINALNDFKDEQCRKCGTGVCRFAGIKKIAPLELVALIREEGN